MGSEEHHF